jgi:class 3 adenylate cyclase
MANLQRKSLRSPDDVIELPGLDERSVQMGEQTIGRAVIQPGWRWSVDVQPIVGTPSCGVRHLGLALSGRLRVETDDGRTIEIGRDDVFDIPPGHDAWVVGDEPFESVEVIGIYGFGKPGAEGNAYVTSVLMTDIADSTATLQRLGEAKWRDLLGSHLARVRRALDRHRGVEVATTGDGMLATFDGAARAIRCAVGLHAEATDLGISIRAGVHTGEVEPIPGNIRGLTVHVVSRIVAIARPGETLVSTTTREMVSAPDIAFDDRGTHEFKGIREARQLWSASILEPGGLQR